MLTKTLKRLAFQALPGPMSRMQIVWKRRHNDRIERTMGLPRITAACVEHLGLRVKGGPFAGMQYVSRAVGSAFVPKLLGCYEEELHRVIHRVLAHHYTTVVDIGCAEGYYAVGIARALPEAHVYAFDTDFLAQRLCSEMAEVNGVAGRVTVAGRCEAGLLETLLKDTPAHQALVICDCEGYERELLRPEAAPSLRTADILVEMHDCFAPGVSEDVLPRFAETHTVTLLPTTVRDGVLVLPLQFLPEAERTIAISEGRPAGQQWAWLTATGYRND